MDIVAAAILIVRAVERLIDVADEMNEELEKQLVNLFRCCRLEILLGDVSDDVVAFASRTPSF